MLMCIVPPELASGIKPFTLLACCWVLSRKSRAFCVFEGGFCPLSASDWGACDWLPPIAALLASPAGAVPAAGDGALPALLSCAPFGCWLASTSPGCAEPPTDPEESAPPPDEAPVPPEAVEAFCVELAETPEAPCVELPGVPGTPEDPCVELPEAPEAPDVPCAGIPEAGLLLAPDDGAPDGAVWLPCEGMPVDGILSPPPLLPLDPVPPPLSPRSAFD